MSNIEKFFGRMYASCNALSLTYLGQSSTREVIDDIRVIVNNIQVGYSGIYYKVKINIDEVTEVSEPVNFLEYLYKFVRESRAIFVDSWILSRLDDISELIASLLYQVKYKR